MITIAALIIVIIFTALGLFTVMRRESDIAMIQLLLAALVLGLTVGRFLPF